MSNIKTQKISVTAFIDLVTDEPQGFIYFSKNRDYVIYKVEKAGEEDIEQLVKGDDPIVTKKMLVDSNKGQA